IIITGIAIMMRARAAFDALDLHRVSKIIPALHLEEIGHDRPIAEIKLVLGQVGIIILHDILKADFGMALETWFTCIGVAVRRELLLDQIDAEIRNMLGLNGEHRRFAEAWHVSEDRKGFDPRQHLVADIHCIAVCGAHGEGLGSMTSRRTSVSSPPALPVVLSPMRSATSKVPPATPMWAGMLMMSRCFGGVGNSSIMMSRTSFESEMIAPSGDTMSVSAVSRMPRDE